MTTMGAVIIAGGGAKRMGGFDKGLLRFRGRPFIELLLEQLRGFPEILLSVDTAERYARYSLPTLVDVEPGQGPMRGLAQALAACRSDALLALAVDMPLFERGLADYLAAFFHPGCGAVTALDRSGRRHPLCAIYAKSAAGLFRERLAAGKRRLRDALEPLCAVDAPLAHSAYLDAALANINSPAELAALRRGGPPPVLAVCGVKNSGKTTLLCRLAPLLRRKGLRIGVVKHDGHDFVPDVPGTDSFRLREAGAECVAVYSPSRMLFTREGSGIGLETLLPQFHGLDLVLVEGGKSTTLPKLEVVREGAPQSNPEGRLAICSDTDVEAGGLPVLSPDDHDGICRLVLDWLAKERGCA